VEDSEQFTGAGLYDSFSGCLADDLDNDTAGPSRGDPTDGDERGVFGRSAKVHASFYNVRLPGALKHDVNEAQVGMALLMHCSFPDDISCGCCHEEDRSSGWSVFRQPEGRLRDESQRTGAEEVHIDVGFQDLRRR
jgi:hypothetical protein